MCGLPGHAPLPRWGGPPACGRARSAAVGVWPSAWMMVIARWTLDGSAAGVKPAKSSSTACRKCAGRCRRHRRPLQNIEVLGLAGDDRDRLDAAGDPCRSPRSDGGRGRHRRARTTWTRPRPRNHPALRCREPWGGEDAGGLHNVSRGVRRRVGHAASALMSSAILNWPGFGAVAASNACCTWLTGYTSLT